MNEKITNTDLFQVIFDASLAGLFVVNELGFILIANQTAENLFDYSAGELANMNIHMIVPDWKKNAEAAQSKKNRAEPIQFFGLKKNGISFPLDIRCAPTVLKGQNLFALYCKPADTPVFESDRRFRNLVSNVAGIVYSCKAHSPYYMEFISETCKAISGYSPQQFYDDPELSWENLIHNEDLPKVLKELGRAVKEKRAYQLSYRIITSLKAIKWIWEQGSFVTDDQNVPFRREGFMHDVTDLKTVENALVKEKKLLRQYMDTSPSMFLVINKDHTVELVNKRTCEILGIEQDAILHKDWFTEFIPKRNKKQLIELFESIFEDKLNLPNFYENHVVSKGGQERLIQWNNAALRNGNNEIVGVVSSGLDITDTKLIQNTLNIRNRALEAAGNGIVIVDAHDPELPIIYCNQSFTHITGYEGSEVIGKNCRFLQNDDRDQPEIRDLAIAIQQGRPCRVVLRNYRKDGTLFWNDLSITPLYDEDQKLTHIIGVLNDVTEIQQNKRKLEEYALQLEYKVEEQTKEVQSAVQQLVTTSLNLEDQVVETNRAERKAKLSQALFTAIAHNFPNGVIMIFNTDYELVYVEGEEMDRIDIMKSHFEGIPIYDIPIFSKQQLKKIKSDIEKTLEGANISFEIEFKDQYYAVNSTPLYSDEKEIKWALFVYNNVTEQKEVQYKLEKTLLVEKELNELKSRFISIASHEFRTPLSAILSSAILIGKQNEPGKEDRRMKHVTRITTNVRDLVVILNDFLSLSKLEEGMVQVKPQIFDLIQFVKILIDEMEPNKKEGQNIFLEHSKPAITVFLDPKLLSHILINLLTNAIKYSEQQQMINIKISIKRKSLFIAIKDNGMGIPKEEHKNLFNRFFRAENATNIQGTGLGLHIVKQYTELLGGSISFKSKMGEGSTFSLKLPVNINEYEKNSVN
ncbi:PAS domain S-box protein [Arenibacter sp. BSSL-BM3]|uniref:histidine kinase n=1 Tax=Arenibacter arenosicollis TaxID=2762274 RepID=A0ABR7QN71_9FLAO|nr:PAS domain S-box protein [Arenibacter arenosicollis]MBC8768642.1 PAS domain S-box protein [Arenibacter arenosicollis]